MVHKFIANTGNGLSLKYVSPTYVVRSETSFQSFTGSIYGLVCLYALSPQVCGFHDLCIYMRQITHAHVTTITNAC